MCGFAGYISLTHKFEVDDKLLEQMHLCIKHRGPDDYGVRVYDAQKAVLVHRRLSIIDLSAAGKQPMHDATGNYVVSFNGEIYNYQSLKKELESLGHRFITHTDTEVLLLAFKQWGIDCLSKLEGMFAGVFGNLQTREWFFIRDRIGIKPVYFSTANGYFSFASEPKSLFVLPWVKKELSFAGMYHYFTFMVAPAPWTLFKGVYKLPAGHYAKLDTKKNLTFHEWYNPLDASIVYSQSEVNDEYFSKMRIKTLLSNSVRKRMMADVSLGVFLSGGVDSSLLTALLSEATGRVQTFNISFKDGPEYCEAEWARKVAHHFGTQHHEIQIDEADATHFFEKMVHYQDDPISDCVSIPLYYVSKLLKESGVSVVHVGEGSDELFCGYQNYVNYLTTYQNYYQPTYYIPQSIKKAGYWTAAKLFPHKKYRLGLLHQWASGQHLFWSGAVAFSEALKKEILHFKTPEFDPMIEKIYPSINQSYNSYAIVDYHLNQLYQKKPDADFLTSMIYLELKQRLPELLLMRVDKMTMACGVEARVPFLDHTLVEFALQVPKTLKYRNGQTKYILKKMAENFLPHDIIYRKKVGFAAPISRWFKQKKTMHHSFALQLEKNNGINLNTAFISKMFKNNLTSDYDNALPLWVIHTVLATGVV